MTLIADVVTAITGSPAPVLFLDSCILLDIVRAPLRDKPTEVQFARLFLDSVQKAPKTIHLVVASPTPREWTDHIAEAENDCTSAVKAYDATASIYGHLGHPAIAAFPSGVPVLPTMLRQLSADILAAAVALDHDAAALGRAVDRIINSTHPAKAGGKGAKDSVILEHAVEATTRLRNAGFTGICLFVSLCHPAKSVRNLSRNGTRSTGGSAPRLTPASRGWPRGRVQPALVSLAGAASRGGG